MKYKTMEERHKINMEYLEENLKFGDGEELGINTRNSKKGLEQIMEIELTRTENLAFTAGMAFMTKILLEEEQNDTTKKDR